MASKKRRTTKSKVGKRRATIRKKTVKRAVAKRTKKSAKKPRKPRRSAVSKRIQVRQQKRGATPVVEKTIIDVIDEPLPGIVRLTEIEEMEVAARDTEEEE